jgi:ketosteroid isomerase-like protein
LAEAEERALRNAETVRTIDEAFGRGDVSAILDTLDDAVEWETRAPVPAVPWLQCRSGRANIAGFCEAIAALTITRFEPHAIFDGGDKVSVRIAFEATCRGKSYAIPNDGHLWEVNLAGKAVRYDHVTDTAQMSTMARAE